MKRRKTFISVVCIILVVLMVLSITVMVIAPTAHAQTSAEIQDEIDELNGQRSAIQGRMDDIQAEIDSLDYEKANALEKKLMLDQKNQLAQEEIQVIDEQIAIIDGLIGNMQQDLEKARKEEEYQRQRWVTRLRAMEETSDVNYIEVLFEASSFSDLLTRLDLVGEVMEYDEDLEAEYVAARENVEALEAEAEVMFAQNEARRQEQEQKKAQLEADIASACQIIAQMETNIDEYNEVMDQEEATMAEVTALVVQKEKELKEAKAAEEAERLRKLAEQQAAMGGGSSPPAATLGGGGSAWMMWPSYTTVITSHYGMRTDPVSGKIYRLHAGCDIGASYGSSIYAAAAGTVILAGWNGGYGNCVMVNHGNGYTTLYGHMSRIAVSNGQAVAQGQVLGYVGSTGNSTGPHLHFEVRVSSTGATINPLSFTYY